MRKWLSLLVGIGIALWFHAGFDAQTTLLDFVLVFLVAGAFFLYGAPPPPATPLYTRRTSSSWRASPWFAAGSTLLALAAVAGAAWLLWQDLSDLRGLGLWIVGAGLLLFGWWQVAVTVPAAPEETASAPREGRANQHDATVGDASAHAQTPSPADKPRQRWVWWVLLAIVVVALVVRLWDIESYPYGLQSDEGNNARDALLWLNSAPYTPYAESNRGQATLFTYLIALNFKLFGVDVLAMRYTSVFVGMLTVLSFYVLARLLLSPGAALLSTALLAVSRWHITFSRIVYELIMTPLALIWLFYFFYRGLRERTPRYFILAGLAMAFGFNTYTAFRIAPLGLALLCLFWLVQNWRQVWGNLGRLLLFSLSTLIGLLPLGIYAAQKPEVMLWRIRELSIFDEIAAAGTWQPFWHNVRSYALMFNLKGDNAALNNLAGIPMVSWVAAALFILGLLYALRYWRHLSLFLMLAWVVAVIPAGILSVTVETPSARRVIGLLPLIFLLVGIVADGMRRATITTWRGQLRSFWPIGATLLVAIFAFTELKTFFTAQATNIHVQRAFNIIEWSVGDYMATVDTATTRILLDQSYVDNNVVTFAAQGKSYTTLDVSRDIPFQRADLNGTDGAANVDLLYILRPSYSQFRSLLEHFYPGGQWQDHFDAQGMLLFNTFSLPWSVRQQAQGLIARYYAYPDDGASEIPPTLLAERVEPTIGGGAPVPAPYRVVWSGSLQVQQHGQYQFTVESRAPFTLTVADQTITDRTSVTAPLTATLYAGIHPLQLTMTVTETETESSTAAEPTPRILWSGPVAEEPVPARALWTVAPPTQGLIGAYYPNNGWEGAPTVIRHDLVVGPNEVLPNPYSVIWRGKFWAPSDALYTLGINADDGAQLYLDEQLIVDNGGLHGAKYVANSVQLSAGLHDVAIHYVQDGGAQAMDLTWNWPDGGQQPLPMQQLLPNAIDVASLVSAAAPAPVSVAPPPSTAVAADQVMIVHEADGAFAQPRGVAVANDGSIYIADTGNQRLVGLNADGTVRFVQSDAAEPLQEPFDVGVDGAGQIYLLDPTAGRIEVFAADGTYQRLLTANPDVAGRARGLFVTPNGEVWVAHTPGARIIQLNAQGEEARIIPIAGAQPVDVAVDSAGVIYVTEVEQHRLLRLDTNGQVVAEISIPIANGVDSPHLAVDAQNFLYVTEPEPGSLLKLGPDGGVVSRQQLPAPPGSIVKPIGIAVSSQGQIWFADVLGGGVWQLAPENR